MQLIFWCKAYLGVLCMSRNDLGVAENSWRVDVTVPHDGKLIGVP